MILLQSMTQQSRPEWDGSRVLFELLVAGRQVPCAISRMALEDIAERPAAGTADLLGCFAAARDRIEEIALQKLHARQGGGRGRLSLWVDDIDDGPPEGVAGAARLAASALRLA